MLERWRSDTRAALPSPSHTTDGKDETAQEEARLTAASSSYTPAACSREEAAREEHQPLTPLGAPLLGVWGGGACHAAPTGVGGDAVGEGGLLMIYLC